MSEPAQELEQARRLRQSVSAACVDIRRECARLRSLSADHMREVAAIQERLRTIRGRAGYRRRRLP